MAKQQRNQIPTAVPQPAAMTDTESPEISPATVATAERPPQPMPQVMPVSRSVAIDVPIGAAVGYCQHRVDLVLSEPQAVALRSIVAGLARAESLLPNGRPVRDGADAIAWLLQRVAENARP